MNTEKQPLKHSNYKSPKRKLIKFFKESRNNWKKKCLNAKYTIKLLRNQVRYLEKRKTELSQQVKELKKELGESRLKKN